MNDEARRAEIERYRGPAASCTCGYGYSMPCSFHEPEKNMEYCKARDAGRASRGAPDSLTGEEEA